MLVEFLAIVICFLISKRLVHRLKPAVSIVIIIIIKKEFRVALIVHRMTLLMNKGHYTCAHG